MKLYSQFEQDLAYRYSMWLKGYQLHSLGPYPCAVVSSNRDSKILVEVMQIKSLETERAIHQIEMDAGYYFISIPIQDQAVGIYLFHDATNYPIVPGGDWVTFFGK